MSIAGRLCCETECCEWGNINSESTNCSICDISFIPNIEHNKDINDYYIEYYGTDKDDGDICLLCLINIFFIDNK